MSDSYDLKVMGIPGLFRSDGRPVRLKVRKHLALLIHFALEGRPTYRRDELVELLWPAARELNGRQSLSMALSAFRPILGPNWARGTHAIVQISNLPLRLDLQQLARREILGSEVEPPLEVDGLLRDFEIEDAPAFLHWRDRKRAEFFPAIKAGILRFVDQARRSGDTTTMRAFADRLLDLDHLAEEAIEARMEAFAMQGDRLGALRDFEQWKRALQAELGASPSEKTETLAARLRRRNPPSVGPDVSRQLIKPQTERPFVGRTTEYRTLFDAWEATRELKTSHVLITGESGIGKSTLAMRFGAAAALAGAVVARVQCFELEQRIAFGMIGALVTMLFDQPGAVATAPESLAEIARIVPRVRERFTNLPPPRSVEGEAVRLHFAEAVIALCDAIMEEHPLVLIVDDYPRSDEASLSVLHMLLRQSANKRLMVVLAGRPPEGDEPAQAVRIRKAVSYLTLHKIEIEPLKESDCEELIVAVLGRGGREPGAPERRILIRASAGNPMALELLAQDWKAHPDNPFAIMLTAMRSDLPHAALEVVEYDQLIDRMLPQLTPRNRAALFLAAILGPRLNNLNHFSLVGLTPAKATGALSEMVQERILRTSESGLEFTNEVLRARIYQKIPPGPRIRLHGAVADRLLAQEKAGQVVSDMEIAWHCMRGRRVDEATPHLLRAARDAIAKGAPDEAARALSTGILNLRGAARVEAALLLAATYREMGAWRETFECLRPYYQTGVLDKTSQQSADVLAAESKYELGQYSPQELTSLASDLLRRVRTSEDTPTRLHAVRLAIKCGQSTDRPQVLSAANDALAELSPEELATRDAAALLVFQALADYIVRENGAGLRKILKAARLLVQEGVNDSSFVEACIGQGAFASANGDYEACISPTMRAYETALRLDNTSYIANAANNLALCYYRLGLKEDFLRWALVGRNRAHGTKAGSHERMLAERYCSFGYFQAGNRTKASEAHEQLREERRITQADNTRQLAMISEADFLWVAGDRSGALRIIEDMFGATPRAVDIGLAGSVARWAVVLQTNRRGSREVLDLLADTRGRLDRLDALDQAEVLCSLALLEPSGARHSDLMSQARQALARLPPNCASQLEQLGLRIV